MEVWIVPNLLCTQTNNLVYISFCTCASMSKGFKSPEVVFSINVRLIFGSTSSVWDVPFSSTLPIECIVKLLFFVCTILIYYFFSLETSGFVDKLFESLYTKNYLPPLELVKPEPKPPVQEKEEIKEEVMQSFLLLLGAS